LVCSECGLDVDVCTGATSYRKAKGGNTASRNDDVLARDFRRFGAEAKIKNLTKKRQLVQNAYEAKRIDNKISQERLKLAA
jgi:hypothetical protein